MNKEKIAVHSHPSDKSNSMQFCYVIFSTYFLFMVKHKAFVRALYQKKKTKLYMQ